MAFCYYGIKMKKSLLVVIIFYFLVLFQNNFLAHFAVSGWTMNAVLCLAVFFNIADAMGWRHFAGTSLAAATAAGFFLDVFSSGFIGGYFLLFLTLFFFFNLIFKKYVRISIQKE